MSNSTAASQRLGSLRGSTNGDDIEIAEVEAYYMSGPKKKRGRPIIQGRPSFSVFLGRVTEGPCH